ncbi:hypothetical protein K1719_034392 [Acacia pycnantha]|nr:hypothetical protein K1719_034374 [Acacia pycnantha]KAI9083691.1 hypothetical protein K1719_034392 [Acacia pycnantha]
MLLVLLCSVISRVDVLEQVLFSLFDLHFASAARVVFFIIWVLFCFSYPWKEKKNQRANFFPPWTPKNSRTSFRRWRRRLDLEAFVSELCAGFKLLWDPEMGLITGESLRRTLLFWGWKG